MSDWILLFQVFANPGQYAQPLMIENFETKALCEQASEAIKQNYEAVETKCLQVKKQNEHYE